MSTLLERMEAFITEQELCDPGGRLLLTVSGGIDSMVMAHLLTVAGYDCGVAHCNFSLRGEESDEDEMFVRSWAADRDLLFYAKRFDTERYAEEHGLSIQMAARDLRYAWFRQVAREEGYDRIALAHNRNDLAETFLINLVRGTGLRGLTGIRPRQGELIRPLLFARREEIAAFAREEGIRWREDSSNLSVKYTRNKIRHEIIPAFEELNPSFVDTVAATAARLAGVDSIFARYIEEVRPQFLVEHGGRLMIPLEKLRQAPAHAAILFELLSPLGFSPGTVGEILRALDSPPGKQFFSPTHRLIKDREFLIITPLAAGEEEKRYYIEEGATGITEPLRLRLSYLTRDEHFRIPASPDIAVIDRDRITWPLVVRRWQQGDYFRPLGMSGMKKLSDFFIDRKLSLDDKEKIWLITEGDRIVWIPGMRLDDRYKITDTTEKILQIEWLR